MGGQNGRRGTVGVFIRVEPIRGQKPTGVVQTGRGIAIAQIKLEKQRVSKWPEIPQIPSEVRGRARKRAFPMIDGFVYF